MKLRRTVVALALIALMAALPFAVYSDQTIDSGQFYFQVQSEVGVEGFQFNQLDSGNLELVSQFKALSDQLVAEFGTDKLFNQDVVLTPDLQLVSYTLNSETDRGSVDVSVDVKNSVATIHFDSKAADGTENKQDRQVILENNIVTTGIAASQFLLLQKYINQNVDFSKSDSVTVNAFDPTNINNPFVELTIKKLDPITIEDSSSKKHYQVNRIDVSQNEFDAQLLSCPKVIADSVCTEAGRFLGFLSSTSSLAGVQLSDAPNSGGAKVDSVASGSFADSAGLKAGDIITAIDGQTVKDSLGFRDLVRFKNPKNPVKLTVTRDGQSMEITVQLSGSSLTVYRVDLFEAGFTVVGS